MDDLGSSPVKKNSHAPGSDSDVSFTAAVDREDDDSSGDEQEATAGESLLLKELEEAQARNTSRSALIGNPSQPPKRHRKPKITPSNANTSMPPDSSLAAVVPVPAVGPSDYRQELAILKAYAKESVHFRDEKLDQLYVSAMNAQNHAQRSSSFSFSNPSCRRFLIFASLPVDLMYRLSRRMDRLAERARDQKAKLEVARARDEKARWEAARMQERARARSHVEALLKDQQRAAQQDRAQGQGVFQTRLPSSSTPSQIPLKPSLHSSLAPLPKPSTSRASRSSSHHRPHLPSSSSAPIKVPSLPSSLSKMAPAPKGSTSCGPSSGSSQQQHRDQFNNLFQQHQGKPKSSASLPPSSSTGQPPAVATKSKGVIDLTIDSDSD